MPATRLGRSQLARLFQVLLALRSDRCPNARMLGEECEVSVRTIYRDLGTLVAAGLPVRFVPERQGYRLGPSPPIPPPPLDRAEAMALVVAVGALGAGGLPGLGAAARSGLRKILTAVPEPLRSELLALRERVGGVGPSNPARAASGAVDGTLVLLGALALERDVLVQLEEPRAEAQRLCPVRLLRHKEGWRLSARRIDTNEVVHIAVDRIRSVDVIQLPFGSSSRRRLDRTPPVGLGG